VRTPQRSNKIAQKPPFAQSLSTNRLKTLKNPRKFKKTHFLRKKRLRLGNTGTRYPFTGGAEAHDTVANTKKFKAARRTLQGRTGLILSSDGMRCCLT
jgi:hypothetical protein